MNTRAQKACAWSGFVGMNLVAAAFIFGKVLPPPSPSMPEAEMVARYIEIAPNMQFGMILLYLGSTFFMPFFGLISVYLRRIEGSDFPLFSYMQLIAGALNTLLFMIGPVLLLIMLFRLDRAPELTYLMSDIGWIILILPIPAGIIQVVSVAFCIFSDKSENPLFPRWVGYLNLWLILGFLPTIAGFIVHSGPFAWNGIFSFWIPGLTLGIWFGIMLYLLLGAINRTEAEYKQS